MSLTHFLGVSLLALIIRWGVSIHGYSGAGKPPMFGDYEAQRHWMEITFNLPVEQWYENTTHNDLEYWGLDYPPLTAYHSWLCGALAHRLNSTWVDLFTSRGLESPQSKLFMRSTVILVDVLIFFPAVFLYFSKCIPSITPRLKVVYSLLMLLYPGLLLIDHGHFQYNCVSLGFCLWGLVMILKGRDLFGCIAFVLALNYKQMELYHAMPFFCYLLGSSFRSKEIWLWKLIKIGVVTVLTFGLCWAPFLHNLRIALQVVHRLFPFARGLYEDKVANIWCSLSLFVKIKEMFQVEDLIKICLASTALALTPSSLHLLIRPSKRTFTYALVNSSLIFFLFSFQVHEKSILIPAVSVCTLFPRHPFAAMWFLLLSVLSMFPLLVRDGLLIPTLATTVVFFVATCSLSEIVLPVQQKSKKGAATLTETPFLFWPEEIMETSIFLLSMIGCVILGAMHLFARPPPDLPDLYPVLIAAFSCAHFSVFLLYFHWQQMFASDTSPQNLSSSRAKHETAHKMKKYN